MKCINCLTESENNVCQNCLFNYLSKNKLLESNPYYKKNNFANKNCKTCNKLFKDSKCSTHQKKIREFCSVKCRDECTKCCLCNEEFKVFSLVPLCNDCDEMSKQNPSFWKLVFTGLLSCSKVVSKPWGIEIHIINHKLYCLKYLIFFKDCYFSNHYHLLKTELWHVLHGSFEMLITKDNKETISEFKLGNKIEILPGTIHQLFAKEDSIILEVSTEHFDSDSKYITSAI